MYVSYQMLFYSSVKCIKRKIYYSRSVVLTIEKKYTQLNDKNESELSKTVK
jgi:hypothetical protein